MSSDEERDGVSDNSAGWTIVDQLMQNGKGDKDINNTTEGIGQVSVLEGYKPSGIHNNCIVLLATASDFLLIRRERPLLGFDPPYNRSGRYA
jgi:hypothetical protein